MKEEMTKIKVAVIAGGDSSELPVSLRSAAAVCGSLDRMKFDPTIVRLSREGWVTEGGAMIDRNDFSAPSIGRFDYALIMIHGTPGENGILQGYFELIGLPYSTSSVMVSALTFDKSLTKLALQGTPGVYFARQMTVARGEVVDPRAIVAELGLPMFIKPNASGSSFGVTKVKSIDQIEAAINNALTEGDLVLCEEFIDGVEVSQGVMVVDGAQYVLPITELVSHNEFFDYEAKYTAGMTDEITPARISDEIAASVSRATLAIYKKLGCRGVVRVDYIIRGEKAYFIEVNIVPGMSEASIVPQQWAYIGMTMGEAWEKIILSTIK